MKRSFGILIIVLLHVFTVKAQCEEVYLKGRVVDSTAFQSFYNLMVINMTTHQGVYGRPDGSFSVYARPGDKIAFSVRGYPKKYLIVRPTGDVCALDTVIYLGMNTQEFDPITVHPIKSLEEIKSEREALSLRETRTVTGINAFESPITALYERFSKRARSKRFVAEAEHQDDINQVVKELLRAYVSYDVIYLDEEEFTHFINFLNMDSHFLKTATDYDLIMYIQGKLEHYKELHPELFPR